LLEGFRGILEAVKEGRFAGKVALVTGGTRGIGRAILLALCGEGAECIFSYTKNHELAESVAKELQGAGRRALPFSLM